MDPRMFRAGLTRRSALRALVGAAATLPVAYLCRPMAWAADDAGPRFVPGDRAELGSGNGERAAHGASRPWLE